MSAPLEADIPGIGKFVFAQRTIRTQFLIEGKISRLLGGPVNDDVLRAGAGMFAELEVLTISSPEGWSLDDMDPFDTSGEMARLWTVHEGLRQAEERFRGGSQGDGTGKGQALSDAA